MEKQNVAKIPRMSCKRINFEAEESIVLSQLSASSCPTSTPIRTVKHQSVESENSPIFPCSQGGSADFDVVWDWNSPQAKEKKSHKRLNFQQQPLRIKRHPSNNHIQDFEKLREELKALKEEIAIVDHEESLLLSPMEEAEYKNINNINNSAINSLMPEALSFSNEPELDDIFNDSMDDQLELFSQKLECETLQPKPSFPYKKEIKQSNKCFSNNKIQDSKSDIHTKTFEQIHDLDLDDSFNLLLTQIHDRDLEVMTRVADIKPCDSMKSNFSEKGNSFTRTKSENSHWKTDMNSGKIQFHRTHSFEIANVNYMSALPKQKLEEIERKRLEALAKLEAKRKKEVISNSPLKFSPEEIEKKRLEALAKLEAKKQKEIIERKRKEALRKLEERRRKNATVVKSALTKRL